MHSIEQYRAHAQDCLRRANTDNENDRPLWLTLAQSWLQLAEHADRIRCGEADEGVGEENARDDETVDA